MILHRISRRVKFITEMISRLQPHLPQFPSPVIANKPPSPLNPSRATIQIRCFRSSRPTDSQKISVSKGNQTTHYSTPSRPSRSARIEAQDALFDYLYGTRNLQFLDADHISKNAPHYVQKLLSGIDEEQEIRSSLSKFFRYNPINEFEPFLESMGLSPSELSLLLPRNLMFLCDDIVLLENYHILCDYGVPRTNIGRMYKEAEGIFRYDYGVLSEKLRALEELGLSKPMVIKLVSCCPSLLIGDVSIEFLNVFGRLKGLGTWDDLIEGYLSKPTACNWKRMLDTIEFLDKVGYSKKQVGSLFKQNPALLFEDSAKNTRVLAGQLLKFGLKINEISTLFVGNPQILSGKFAKNLWQAVCFLSDIGMETHNIASIVSTNFQLLGSHSLKGPKTVRRGLKIGNDELCQILKEDPLKLLSLASKSKNKSTDMATHQDMNKQLEKTTFLLRLGYVENSDEMMKALKQFRGRGDQLQERFDCLVQAGFTSEVVTNMIKLAPAVLNQTKDVLEKKIEYLTSYLGYPLESVIVFPSYLCYDVDRISLRFSMYVWLKKKGAAKPMLSLSTLLACSDTRFVKYFVDVHPDGPAVWESLKKRLPHSS